MVIAAKGIRPNHATAQSMYCAKGVTTAANRLASTGEKIPAKPTRSPPPKITATAHSVMKLDRGDSRDTLEKWMAHNGVVSTNAPNVADNVETK